jgi:hypothetical protein
MPEEGRYYPALFQKPNVVDSKDVPWNWTGQWIQTEEAQEAQGAMGAMGAMGAVALVPMILASGIHTFFGTAAYKILPTIGDHSQETMMGELDAMVAAARERQFEPDLKLAVLDELRKLGVVTVDAADSAAAYVAHPNSIVTIDLYIVVAGMSAGGFSSKSANPVQTFHLDVRAEVSGSAGTLATLRLKFDSKSARYREWAADDASRFAAVRSDSIRTVAAELAGRLTSGPSRHPVSTTTYLAAEP